MREQRKREGEKSLDFECVIFLNSLEVCIVLGHTILSMVVSIEFKFNT